MRRVAPLICLLFLLLGAVGTAQENEAYTKVLDRLTSISHFVDRPVLFIIGVDTTGSMALEFDRSKRIMQTILTRYAAPGDSIYIFGFDNKPAEYGTLDGPTVITGDSPDQQISTICQTLLSLPRSGAQGTVFGRAKMFALEKMQELGQDRNVVVLLFHDNYSEAEMGTNERKRLEDLENQVPTRTETVPLYSNGVSALWLTLYTNSFPQVQPLLGPDGESDLDNPRLAWVARRLGSQSLEFISPAESRVDPGTVEVVVQFVGPAEPESATLTVNGKDRQTTSFTDGRASWSVPDLPAGTHVLFAQAVLSDGKVRSAEQQIVVAPRPSPTPDSTPIPSKSESAPVDRQERPPGPSFPFIPFLLLALIAAALYLASFRQVRIRVIGPDSEEVFILPKGKTLRVGGSPRVESDLVFPAGLSQSIVTVRCLPFGRAKIFSHEELNDGTVELETDEGYLVSASGEILTTSATATFTNQRGRVQVFTLVKEHTSGRNSQTTEHFGSHDGEDESDGGGSDWRS